MQNQKYLELALNAIKSYELNNPGSEDDPNPIKDDPTALFLDFEDLAPEPFHLFEEKQETENQCSLVASSAVASSASARAASGASGASASIESKSIVEQKEPAERKVDKEKLDELYQAVLEGNIQKIKQLGSLFHYNYPSFQIELQAVVKALQRKDAERLCFLIPQIQYSILILLSSVGLVDISQIRSPQRLLKTDPKLEELFQAIKNAPEEDTVISLITDSQVNLNAIHYQHECNALFFAIRNFDARMVFILLKLGADPNQGDVYYTPAVERIASSLHMRLTCDYGKTPDHDFIKTAEKIVDLLFCYGYNQSESFKPKTLRFSQDELHQANVNELLTPKEKVDQLLCKLDYIGPFEGPFGFMISRVVRHVFNTEREKQKEQENKQFKDLSCDSFVGTQALIKQEKSALLFQYKKAGLSDYLPHDVVSDLVLEYLDVDINETIARNRLSENRFVKFIRK